MEMVQKSNNLENCLIMVCTLNDFNHSPMIRRHTSEETSVAMRRRELRLTRISVIIVFIFIICHVPRSIPNIAEFVLGKLPRVRFLVMYPSSLGSVQLGFSSSWRFFSSARLVRFLSQLAF